MIDQDTNNQIYLQTKQRLYDRHPSNKKIWDTLAKHVAHQPVKRVDNELWHPIENCVYHQLEHCIQNRMRIND